MNNRIPQWVFVIGGTCISALVVLSAGLASYIFTTQASKIDRIEQSVGSFGQRLAVVEAKIDTNNTFLREKKQNDEKEN